MLELGGQFGHFEIIEELGRGGMAVVYRAYDNKNNQEVALKVLYDQWMNDEEIVKRFAREAEVIHRLDHRNIVPIIDYGDVKGRLFLALAYMDGGTLADRFSKPRSVSLKATLSLLRQVAQGLDYAHSQGVIHRDLKLQNVLLDNNNNVYITDFGIARLIDSTRLTATGYISGTPRYMSPEQARGDAVDNRTDIYAFSVMAYLMLTGFYPFTADDPIAIIQKHMYESPPSPSVVNPQLPPSVDTVLLRGLEKDITNRYDSTMGMMQALVKTLRSPNVANTTTIVNTTQRNPLQSIPLTQVADARNIQAPLSSAERTQISNKNRTFAMGGFAVAMIAVMFAIVGMVATRAQNDILPTSAAAMLPTIDPTELRLQFSAELTATANYLASLPTNTLTPSMTPTPSSTPMPSPTPTKTPTLTPSPTITNTPPVSPTTETTPIEFLFPDSDAQVNQIEGAAIYNGAGAEFGAMGILPYRSLLTLLGRDALGNWVEARSQQGFTGWMEVSGMDLYVDVLTLPITWDGINTDSNEESAADTETSSNPIQVIGGEQIIIETTATPSGSGSSNKTNTNNGVEPTAVEAWEELQSYFYYDSWLLDGPSLNCDILDNGLQKGWKFEAVYRPVDTKDWLYGYVFETNSWGWIETGDLDLTFDLNDVRIDYDYYEGDC